MPPSENIREQLIQATITLIEEKNGVPEAVTIRAVAEKAGVSIGLINYHFGTKEHLLECAVQTIISGVIRSFHPDREYPSEMERLIGWATSVFEFLFSHPEVSQISILTDHKFPSENCNTANTEKGFLLALSPETRCSEQARIIIFALTAAMQSAFLFRENFKELTGYSLKTPEERSIYIHDLVKALFNGFQSS